MEPMVSESSDSEDGLFDSMVGNSISPKNAFSDEDSLVIYSFLTCILERICNLIFTGESVFGYLRRSRDAQQAERPRRSSAAVYA